MSPLVDIPLEVLLSHILPFVPSPDLLRLGCTNTFFAALCNDETLWKRKLLQDFNFSGQETARTTGYKLIYKGLSDPKVFVWGEKANSRLGRKNTPRTVVPGVPFPISLNLPRVVSLVAGGMSFHALDSQGNVHAWGTLDGTQFHTTAQGFSYPAKEATVPHKLKMPAPIRSISSGRLHSSCWDTDNKIWTFTNWGRPFRLSSPILKDPDYAPKQIECGWQFTSMLTNSGDVLVWWPFDGDLGTLVRQKMREMNDQDKTTRLDKTTILCAPWAVDLAPTRLPPIPSLPRLNDFVEDSTREVLIQIAAFDNHIVGLTNVGRILKITLHDENGEGVGEWEYLPNFSELNRLAETPEFSSSDLPRTLRISHISANFQHFVAYTTGRSSVVLLGDADTVAETQPNIIPELQNKSVISVVIGDYHNAALTSDGKLFTWGAYSNGALGLGDPIHITPGAPGGFANQQTLQQAVQNRRGTPPDVHRPTEVRFDHDGSIARSFCFSVAAAGWHTGALVIDLEPGEKQPEALTEDPEPTPSSSSAPNEGVQFSAIRPRIGGLFTPGIFRLGHAAAFGQPGGGSR